jgi:predicted nucleic acid-binding protein
MSAEYFLDTNIVAYAFDQSAHEKRSRAISLMEDHAPWVISWQILQEFSNVALHRFRIPLTAQFLTDFNEHLLWPHCRIQPSAKLYSEALRIHQQSQYRFYDSLIVAAAIESGAGILYSEDLQHGRQIGSLRILNPFLG